MLPALVLTCIVCGYAGTDPIHADPAAELRADAKPAHALPPIAFGSADIAGAAGSARRTPSSDITPAAHEPPPTVTAALTDSSEMLRAEPSLKQEPDAEPVDRTASIGPETEAIDACPASDTTGDTAGDMCTDRYLWTLYQRAPKQDSITSRESRTVTIRKKGKLVTVTRMVAVDAEEDFSWKDPKAAESAGMALMDYVIGGMDRDFKLRLSRLLHAAEQAGLSPGITSAFRDDYRQSIAAGLKAANNRSYHGGSLRGGYGHGLAADIVSVNGETRAERLASTRILWKWIDVHGKEFGIGRPYLGKDPMHVAPIDGQEWAVHRLGKPDQTLSMAKAMTKAGG